MAQQQLSTEEFLSRLSTLLADQNKKCNEKGHASILLTQKRLTSPAKSGVPATSPNNLSDLHPDDSLPILIRATDGEARENRNNRVKISTVVQPDALDDFYARYAEACKAGMTALKKRDKSKDKSKRKKDKAKKKKAKQEAEKNG